MLVAVAVVVVLLVAPGLCALEVALVVGPAVGSSSCSHRSCNCAAAGTGQGS